MLNTRAILHGSPCGWSRLNGVHVVVRMRPPETQNTCTPVAAASARVKKRVYYTWCVPHFVRVCIWVRAECPHALWIRCMQSARRKGVNVFWSGGRLGNGWRLCVLCGWMLSAMCVQFASIVVNVWICTHRTRSYAAPQPPKCAAARDIYKWQEVSLAVR